MDRLCASLNLNSVDRLCASLNLNSVDRLCTHAGILVLALEEVRGLLNMKIYVSCLELLITRIGVLYCQMCKGVVPKLR